MSDALKKPVAPKLRFPEFEGDWKQGTIREFLLKVVEPVDVRPGEQYRQIGIRSHGKGLFHKEAVSGFELGEKRVFWVQANTLVINIVFAWEQALALTTDREKGMIASHRFPMFSAIPGKSDLNFAFHFFMRKRGKGLLALASPGGAGRNKTLGQSEFMKLKVVLPGAGEQTKIATFLSSVDAKLDALGRKHLALRRYKAGLMQRLFSKTFCFARADGSAFPEWKEKKFGQLYDFIPTNSLSRDSLTHITGKIQNIHYGDIHTRFSSQFHQARESIPYIKDELITKQIPNDQFCRIGDLVIADASEDYADIGKAIEILSVKEKSLVAGLHTFIARPISKDIVCGYSGYLFQTFAIRRQIMRIAQGISVLGISKSKLAQLLVPLPHPDEQRKIANALAAIDGKILATVSQLNEMKTFKKSLLQDMFV